MNDATYKRSDKFLDNHNLAFAFAFRHRATGIRKAARSIFNPGSRTCECGRVISANKNSCAKCAGIEVAA